MTIHSKIYLCLFAFIRGKYKSMQSLNTYEHKPPENVEPKQLVILLHGLGSDGRDLIGLAPLLAQDLPEAVFVSPDAPFPCDMAPMGYQWFSLQDRAPEAILKGVQEAAPILEEFIGQQLEKYDLTADKLALVGFSQGTMMGLYAGLRYPEKIAGVLGYSGALIWEEGTAPDSLQKMPVHLIHGEADDIVSVQARAHAQETLEKEGFTVSGHTTPGLAHGIDEAGIKSGSEFLKALF